MLHTILLLLILPNPAFAAASGGGGLPWEAPIQTIANSLTGPVAFSISLLGMLVCGAVLIWGGEINDFVRRLIMLVLVISLLLLGNNLISTLFSRGAVW